MNFSIWKSLEYEVSNSLLVQTYHVCKSVLLVFLRLKTDILITTFDSELDVNALNVKGGMVGYWYVLLSSAGHLAMVGGGFRLMPIASREERRETGRPHLTATDKVRASRQRILPALLLPPLLQLMLMPGIHSGKKSCETRCFRAKGSFFTFA